MENFIVVEVPHMRKPAVWRCLSEQKFIEIAREQEQYDYEEINSIEDAKEIWGEERDIPLALKVCLKEYGSMVQTRYADNDIQYYEASIAISEFELAQKAMFHDLVMGTVLTENEAAEVVEGRAVLPSFHQFGLVKTKLKKLLGEA